MEAQIPGEVPQVRQVKGQEKGERQPWSIKLMVGNEANDLATENNKEPNHGCQVR
jgi:hypothetical protein